MGTVAEYLYQKGYEEGFEQGYEEGYAEGLAMVKKDEATKVLLRMLIKKKEINSIGEILGFSSEELQAIKIKHQQSIYG